MPACWAEVYVRRGRAARTIPSGRRALTVLLVLLVTVPLLSGTAAAATRGGETVVIAEGETVDDDLQAFAGTVIVRGTINGDLQAFAGDVVVTGTVTGDVSAFAGNVRIDGRVGGDVQASGGNVRIGPDAVIAGRLEAGGGNVEIAGTVRGDAQVGAGQITLGPNATIEGSLEYSGELTDRGGTVAGSITERDDLDAGGPGDRFLSGGAFAVYGVLANLVVGAVLLAVFPAFSREIDRLVADEPLRTGGVGLLALFGVPIGLVVVMLAVVTIPLSIVGLLLYVVLVWVGTIYGRIAIGAWLLSLVDVEHRWAALLVGVVLIALLIRVPVAGDLLELAVLLLGLGAIVLGGYRRYRGAEPSTEPVV